MLLIGNVLKPLTKSVLIPLGLTALASATDAAVHEKVFGYGTTTLIISNEEMNAVMKMIKSLKEYGLLIKSASKTAERRVFKYVIRNIRCQFIGKSINR